MPTSSAVGESLTPPPVCGTRKYQGSAKRTYWQPLFGVRVLDPKKKIFGQQLTEAAMDFENTVRGDRLSAAEPSLVDPFWDRDVALHRVALSPIPDEPEPKWCMISGEELNDAVDGAVCGADRGHAVVL